MIFTKTFGRRFDAEIYHNTIGGSLRGVNKFLKQCNIICEMPLRIKSQVTKLFSLRNVQEMASTIFTLSNPIWDLHLKTSQFCLLKSSTRCFHLAIRVEKVKYASNIPFFSFWLFLYRLWLCLVLTNISTHFCYNWFSPWKLEIFSHPVYTVLLPVP